VQVQRDEKERLEKEENRGGGRFRGKAFAHLHYRGRSRSAGGHKQPRPDASRRQGRKLRGKKNIHIKQGRSNSEEKRGLRLWRWELKGRYLKGVWGRRLKRRRSPDGTEKGREVEGNWLVCY